MSTWWLVWAALGLSALSGMLSTLAIALSIVPKAAVEEVGDKSGRERQRRRAQRVMEQWTSHARALWAVKLVLNMLIGAALVWWVAGLREPGTDLLSLRPTWRDALIGGGLTVALLWLMTVVLPMAVALHAGPRVIFARASLISLLRALTAPLAAVGAFSDEVVRRLVGVEKKEIEDQVEEELLTVVEEAEAAGALDEQEADMLASVMKFRDLTVAQIMTPRTDMEAIELTNDLGVLIRSVREVKHSRIPVYDESLDQIIGLFYVKDLMLWLGGEGKTSGKPFELRALLRPAIFVPETKTVRDLLRELIEKKVHIALVADEYGGTAGLVTIEDIVEEVFGDIKDEYEAPSNETPDAVVKLEQKTAELDAAARILDVNELIEPLGVQIPTSEDYDTVGGFVMTTLGRIPPAGERFVHEKMAITVLDAKPTRVVKVQVRVMDEHEGALDVPAPAGTQGAR